jgi:hypothetical protein
VESADKALRLTLLAVAIAVTGLSIGLMAVLLAALAAACVYEIWARVVYGA